jgi:hypothetical protein
MSVADAAMPASDVDMATAAPHLGGPHAPPPFWPPTLQPFARRPIRSKRFNVLDKVPSRHMSIATIA